MAYEQARKYAVENVGNIIPLDPETCQELVSYTLTLPDRDIESHLLGLLGHSDESFKLISTFLDLKKHEDDLKKMQVEKKAEKRAAKTPARLSPGLQGKPGLSAAPGSSGLPGMSLVRKGGVAWAVEDKSPASVPPKTRYVKKSDSLTTLQLLQPKQPAQTSAEMPQKSKKKTLDSLADIDAAISDLEVAKTRELHGLDNGSSIRRVCNCMATRHPLFEVAPNCLNCGKIICSKEGLQPCLSCGRELLSEAEKREIIEVLRREREAMDSKPNGDTLTTTVDQQAKAKPKKIKYGTTSGGNLWKAQDAALKQLEETAKKKRELEAEQARQAQQVVAQQRELEHYSASKAVNPELLKAQERLETLLHFQETGAERSKIIDNAADFEMPGVSSGSMWLSPVERALQLKKQQKQLRKMHTQEKARSGQTKKVVEMVIRDGKVKMVEKAVADEDAGENHEENAEMDGLEHIIKEEKLSHEASLARNTWDPQKDIEKWTRPVYVLGNSERQQSGVEAVGVSRERVQQNKVDDAELIAAMYA